MSETDDTLSYAEAKQVLDDLMARAARDAEFRRLCLFDGRQALMVSCGRELPEGVTVHFVEHAGQGAGIILPPLELDAATLHGTPAGGAAEAPVKVAEAPEAPAPEAKPPAAPRGLNIRPRQ
jgi:hypothetical protein